MAYKISDDCSSCGACESECPNQAISEGGDHYQIATNKCTECVGSFKTPQCADVCPTEAIGPDPAHKETEGQLIEKAQKLNPKLNFSGTFPSHFRK